MPRSDDDAAALWRAKAQDARGQAARMIDSQARSTMLKIAQSYEHLAEIAERAAAARRHSP